MGQAHGNFLKTPPAGYASRATAPKPPGMGGFLGDGSYISRVGDSLLVTRFLAKYAAATYARIVPSAATPKTIMALAPAGIPEGLGGGGGGGFSGRPSRSNLLFLTRILYAYESVDSFMVILTYSFSKSRKPTNAIGDFTIYLTSIDGNRLRATINGSRGSVPSLTWTMGVVCNSKLVVGLEPLIVAFVTLDSLLTTTARDPVSAAISACTSAFGTAEL